ncbi:hypothetical protein [Oceanibaculum pacificum]|uniref:PARP catalytic domain-containing protein n=1 Tax=Oceanibaculum pacificum TaxID=580166 RepID=A0A154W155_9PROT|nr:hypothetical protein [Oceanibaculum pacificum]KZD07181.1 hypothetical protein AUP43_10295 [Oceanibaculum pacificum]
MHDLSSHFVLGYHGCDKKVAERLLKGAPFRTSDNDWDWLGPGIYFWEANPKRGLAFASDISRLKRGPKIDAPYVIGAVIDLRSCLDTTTLSGIAMVESAYGMLQTLHAEMAEPLPSNSRDLLRRYLDCAVMKVMHTSRKEQGLPPVDTVRGIFVEGDPLYENSGFYAKTHTQICVCNPDCIKGVFRVPDRFLT